MPDPVTMPPAAPGQSASGGPAGWSVEWVASAEAIPAAVFEALFPPPHEGRWWYLALERAGLEDQFAFAYAVVRRDGAIVAVAPAFAMDLALEIVLPDAIAPAVAFLGRHVPALRTQRTWFVGSPCAEEGRIGVAAGVTLADVLPVLIPAVEARAKAERAHMIVWKDMPEAMAAGLREPAKASGFFEVASFPGTEIHGLPADFAGYLGKLSGQQRNQLKKKLKNARAVLDIETTVVQTPDAGVRAEIWGLFQQTYARATTRFERLTPAFFVELSKAPTTHFICLRRRDGGALVAFMLCYFDAGCATNKFIGIDYTLGDRTFLYFRLFEEFVLWANAHGATWLRSGQTGYRAKFDLGHDLVPLVNFAKNRNWLMNLISAYVARSISWSTLDADLATYVEARARKGDKRGS